MNIILEIDLLTEIIFTYGFYLTVSILYTK